MKQLSVATYKNTSQNIFCHWWVIPCSWKAPATTAGNNKRSSDLKSHSFFPLWICCTWQRQWPWWPRNSHCCLVCFRRKAAKTLFTFSHISSLFSRKQTRIRTNGKPLKRERQVNSKQHTAFSFSIFSVLFCFSHGEQKNPWLIMWRRREIVIFAWLGILTRGISCWKASRLGSRHVFK